MSTLFSDLSDTTAVSDLREWSEKRLLAAAKNGRRAPFGELCERNVERVFRVVHRIVRIREDAEDAVQDSFLSAFLHLKDFGERSRLATRLTRIAINPALAKLRKKRGLREVPLDEPDPASELGVHWKSQDVAPNPEEACHLHERKQILNKAVTALRPRARNVVRIYQLQEQLVKKTAQILRISATAVKARMFHARGSPRMPLLQSVAKSNRMSAE
jgi:RNA polymerase sigma-70 factor (ECF subfamily)